MFTLKWLENGFHQKRETPQNRWRYPLPFPNLSQFSINIWERVIHSEKLKVTNVMKNFRKSHQTIEWTGVRNNSSPHIQNLKKSKVMITIWLINLVCSFSEMFVQKEKTNCFNFQMLKCMPYFSWDTFHQNNS